MVLRSNRDDDVVEGILNTRVVTPKEVSALRQQVWPEDRVSRAEAELLFEINDTLEAGCAEWTDFFAEAIVAHMVTQQEPRGYVSEEDARWFQSRILGEGTVKGEVELEALLQVIEKAICAPERLQRFALEAVRHAVVQGEGRAIGNPDLKRGVIGDPEAALLRRAIYAPAGDSGAGVSREEAELLFDLNDISSEAENCSAWSALFVNALSNFLLSVSGYKPPTRERMREIDLWLNKSKSDSGSLGETVAAWSRELKSQVNSVGDLLPKAAAFSETFASLFRKVDEAALDGYYGDRGGAPGTGEMQSGRIDADEAAWLIRRIRKDGRVSANELALLSLLRTSGFEIHPAFDPLVKQSA